MVNKIVFLGDDEIVLGEVGNGDITQSSSAANIGVVQILASIGMLVTLLPPAFSFLMGSYTEHFTKRDIELMESVKRTGVPFKSERKIGSTKIKIGNVEITLPTIEEILNLTPPANEDNAGYDENDK